MENELQLENLKQFDAAKLDLIRQTALERFDFFCAAVLDYQVTEFHAKMIEHRFRTRFNMVLAPRGSGKSTILDVAYILWRVLKNCNLRICIASKTGPQAKSFLGQIKMHMENNEKFKLLFGDLRGDTWNEDEIVISTRTKILKEPTICAKAVGAGIPGFHFDIIIGDDLVDMENSATQGQRDKMKHWFYVVLAPTLEPAGEFYIVGTRYHSDDIYGHFAGKKSKAEKAPWNDKRFGPNTLVVPALVTDPETGEERSFWPEYFTLEFLQERREEGILFFNLAYQNDATIAEGGIIALSDLVNYVWSSEEDLPPRHELVIFQGVDPAISLKQTADFFVHVTIGVHNNTHIYVLEIVQRRLSFDDQVALILEKAGKWRPEMIGIESIAYQQALAQAIKSRVHMIPVHEVRHRVDKEMRAKILSQYAQRHELHFHYTMFEAIENLVGMPNPGSGHDDLFDGVDIAVETAKQMALKGSVVVKLRGNARKR